MFCIVLDGNVRNVKTLSYLNKQKILQKLFQIYLWKSRLTTQISIYIIRFAVLLIQFYFNIFFLFLIAWKMEIDDIFPREIFSSKKSARAKILTEWKAALNRFFFQVNEKQRMSIN